MEELKNSFSFRETLEIVFPGLYFMGLILPLMPFIGVDNLSTESITNITIYLIMSVLIGIFFYTLDIPKKLWFFKSILPTNLIEKELKDNTDKNIRSKVANSYFSFYDKNVTKEQKSKTDIYTTIYHFSVNIFILSVILLTLYVILMPDFYSNYIFYTLSFIFIISLFNSFYIIYSPKKIKYMFKRTFDKYKNSDEYKQLTSN